ncbi:MAG TPA: pectinesterase family protein, partial [Niastella sp.]
IYPRTRLDNANGGYVTAVNTKAVSGYGYVFRDCKITKNRGFTFYSLGRPWQNDAGTADASKSRNKTVFLNTIMGSTIKPEGWSSWDAGTNTSYITYGEYNTRNYNGTAANVSGRVSWSKQLTAADAVKYYSNDEVFTNANTPAMATWNPYTIWTELSNPFTPELSASNLIAKKGASTTTLTWNLTWPMTGITCDLYRSTDKTNFSKINTQVSTEDSACNFTFSENNPPAGQTYYYIVRLSKNGYANTTSDTTLVTSKPTIFVQGTLGSFLQGMGTPSSSQTFAVLGENLVAGITITPPAGYEVSSNTTTWYNSTSPLVIAQSNGVVASTNIYVRLNGKAVSAVSGDIVNSSTGATNITVPVSGTVQSDPLNTTSVLLEQWPFTINNQDSASVRAAGVVGTVPVFKNLTISNGTTETAVPAYSALHGQAFGPSTDGSGNWTTAVGGPGSTLSRIHYEQFTVVAAKLYSLRIDSILLATAFYNTSSGTKMAVVYSKSGFRNDSTEVKVMSKNGTPLTPGTLGTFNNAMDIGNQTSGTTDVYAMLLNGSAGITLKAGDTLTFRIYHCTGSGSAGRYAKLKNLVVKGSSVLDAKAVIIVGGVLSTFSQTVGKPTDAKTFTLNVKDVVGTVTLTPPAGYEISIDTGKTWYAAAAVPTLKPDANYSVTRAVMIRLNASGAGTYDGRVVITASGTPDLDVLVSGFAYSEYTVNPNPANSYVNIFHAKLYTQAIIRIYNINGHLMGVWRTKRATGYTTINISNLPNGMYFAEVERLNEKVLLRFLKQ